ncbi:hypothetical protein AWB74_01896 [Caballeronia arvi]|uniref:Uncharacterized protein n=2 Tax=Caballeronia arvi TaxID=1777135 RepID=A0A158HL99_9BURK|nr:hypothetical protein AWB74_01896 [Caballeronia arvi]
MTAAFEDQNSKEAEMSYLNTILAVWATCGIGAVLFIRGATRQEAKPVLVRVRESQRADAKPLGHTA